MKKTLARSMIYLWIILACFSPLTHAQTATSAQPAHTQAASVLPTDIDIFYEMNTAVDNPLEQFLRYELSFDGATDLSTLMLDLADNNTVVFAMDMDTFDGRQEHNMYLTLNVTEDNFKEILDTSAAETIEVYGDTTIYKMDEEAYVVMLGDLFLVTDKLENARIAIGTYAKPETALAGVAAYEAVMGRNLENSFINIYINPAVIASALSTQDMALPELGFTNTLEGLLNALTAESMSVAQVSDGFKFGVAVEADKEKLEALNFTFDKYNFTPSLYKLLSGKDLIYYQERANLKAQIDDVMKMFNLGEDAMAELNTFKVDFKAETGVDFDRELLPLLTKNYLVTVHNSGQLLPAVTIIFDVNNNTNLAGQMMLKISEYLKKEFQKSETEMGKDIFKYNIYSAGGTSFYEFTIYLKNLDNSGDLDSLSDEAATIYLRMAVTSDGKMVFSTLPDLNGMFLKDGEGLLSNAALKAEFTNPSATVNEVAYLDIDNTYRYVNVLLEMFSADSETKTGVEELFKPWHSLFMRSYGDIDSVWVDGKLTFDTAAMGDEWQDLMNTIGSYSMIGTTSEVPVLEPFGFQKSFCDVSASDWFYPYITDLSSQSIISGYEDGCFRPGNPITRAEFVKMAMKALGKAAAINSSYQPFKDVPPIYDAWYSEDINMAAMLGYLKGYSDNTFRPDALITRAEALQILYNMSTRLPAVNVVDQPLESLIRFNDVSKNDWFFKAVVAASYHDLVQGVTPQNFEPSRNITRAEAAKVINLLQTLEQ